MSHKQPATKKRLIQTKYLEEKKTPVKVEVEEPQEESKDERFSYGEKQVNGTLDKYLQNQPVPQPKKQKEVKIVEMDPTNENENLTNMDKPWWIDCAVSDEEDLPVDLPLVRNITRSNMQLPQNNDTSNTLPQDNYINESVVKMVPKTKEFSIEEPVIEEEVVEVKEMQKQVQPQPDIIFEASGQKLSEKVFFIAGEFEEYNKSTIQNILNHHGGKVKFALSKNHILIKGDYYVIVEGDQRQVKKIEDNKQYKDALKSKQQILDKQQLNTYLKQNTGFDLEESFKLLEVQPIVVQQEIVPTSKPKQMESVVKVLQSPMKQSKQVAYNSKPKQQQEPIEIVKPLVQVSETQRVQLWTTKHAPQKVTDCIDQTHVVKIVDWLTNWGNKQSDEIAIQQSFQSQNLNARAALLSGAPGIGKTTIVRLIAKQMRYQLIEWNASDVRSKLQIENYVKHLKDNSVLQFTQGNLTKNEKTIILMDEVDGMSGSDKGGNKCLIEMIKLTKLPIFCICNDRNNQKMRSLANYCLDLQFKPPHSQRVYEKLANICKIENISFQKQELEEMITTCQSDVRQLINNLQMHKFGVKMHLSKDSSKDSSGTKNIYEITKLLLNYKDASTNSLFKLLEYYFIDPDMINVMYQENLLDLKDNSNKDQLNNIAKAAEAIADADIMSSRIRRNGEWSLMPNAGFMSVIYPTQVTKASFFSKVNFPQILGKISSEGKVRRQIRELKDSFQQQTYNVSQQSIKFNIIEPFAFIQITQLSCQPKPCIDEGVKLLQNYQLDPASFEESLISSLSLFPKRDVYTLGVTQPTRTALTKEFKRHIDSSANIDSGVSRRQFQVANTRKYNELEEDHEEVQEDEDKEKPDKPKNGQKKIQQKRTNDKKVTKKGDKGDKKQSKVNTKSKGIK